MSTFTIRLTTPSIAPNGLVYATPGETPDLGAPSAFDIYISGSSDPLLVNGRYDGYCLSPFTDIFLSPTTYSATNALGNTIGSFVPLVIAAITQQQIDKINWVLSQNFTSDSKYTGQYSFGEVQVALWKILGYTDGQLTDPGMVKFLNGNGQNVVTAGDSDFIVSAASAALSSNNGVLPTDAFFTEVIDPAGNVQPLIIQLQSAKLGNFVWADADADGIQDAGEAGVNNVVVELWKNGIKVASTLTGDDFSTAAVENGFYQFAGLGAGSYQVKFIAPTYAFTAQDVNSNASDTLDSDANAATGFSQIVTLAAGESNQTIDAGLVLPARLSGYVYEDAGNDGLRNSEVPIAGVLITLTGTNTLGNAVNATATTNASGFYEFTNLAAGTYTVTETQPSGYLDGKDTAGSTGGSNAVNDVLSSIVLGSGTISTENNFGEIIPASLGDRLWTDNNGNGKQDGGESSTCRRLACSRLLRIRRHSCRIRRTHQGDAAK